VIYDSFDIYINFVENNAKQRDCFFLKIEESHALIDSRKADSCWFKQVFNRFSNFLSSPTK